MSQGHFIGGRWIREGGTDFVSTDPITGGVVWAGPMAREQEVKQAVGAAHDGLEDWVAG